MALIGKIRKNFWFLLLVIGIALAAFIVMDMTSAGNAGGAGGANPVLGNVAGENISYTDFSVAESVLFQGSSANSFSTKSNLWNYFVEKAIVGKQAEKLGVGVSKSELIDLQFGANKSPLINQQLQQGQLTLQQLNEIKTAIETDNLTNPQLRQYWVEQEKQIVKTQEQLKLSNLAAKAAFTPTWMAEQSFYENNNRSDVAYVKIPFDMITETVEVSDADLSSFINANKTKYTIDEETRVVDYYAFDVKATAEDSLKLREKLAETKRNFLNAENDSTFAINNKGQYNNIYFTKDQIPADVQDAVANAAVGDVIGPVLTNGNYLLMKKVDSRVVADTVRAQHILRRATPGDVQQLADANAMIDSLMDLARRGVESFDSLAIKFSDDGSASKGGDLGAFTQGQMVPEFNEVAFITGKERGLYKATTQFGVHLIKVNEQKYNNREPKYKIASITTPVIPSSETQGAVYDEVVDLVSTNRTSAALSEKLANRSDVRLVTSSPLKRNDYTLGVLGADNSSRQIIKWAFDPSTEIDDVSPEVYPYSDKINFYDNKYVIGMLKSVSPAGPMSVDNARDKIYDLVLNQKKGEIVKSKIASKDLSSIAAEYNVEIDTSVNLNFASAFAAGIGNEPKVVAVANMLDENQKSEPIIGQSGVFVVMPVAKKNATTPVNIPQMRATAQTSKRTSIVNNLIEGLKKVVKIEDKRSDFF
jgi:peptidyl-prolyl cis-trans isomerase D